MLRRTVVLILVLSGSFLTGRAQEEGTRIADGDTLHYTYTPLPQEAPKRNHWL